MAKAQTGALTDATIPASPGSSAAERSRADWREVLPTLSAASLTLREPVAADAMPLLTALPPDALAQIVTDPPPATVAGLGQLIEQCQAGRRAGTTACWVLVPDETGVPVGILGVRSMDHTCSVVEGFAVIAEEFRGTSLFHTAGRQALACLFGQMGVHRAEFRIDVRNGRANGALRKLGATQEGLLRRARVADGEFHDQVLWAIVATDWNDCRVARTSSVH
jgi:uncharacterized protein